MNGMNGQVIRLADLTGPQRRLMLALIEAGESPRKERDPAMVEIAEPEIQFVTSVDMPVYRGPVKVAVEWVGPTQARRMLVSNEGNRRKRPLHIATICRDIQNSRFRLNGESVKFSDSGRLLDGQNRLEAIVQSGKGIWTVVVRGLADDSQETIDIGAKRRLADQLHMAGEPNANVLSAALAIAWRLKVNRHLHVGEGYPAPSNEELLDYLVQHPEIRESVKLADRDRRGVLRYPSSVEAGLHHAMAGIDAEAADDFWAQLQEGQGIPTGHPILTLRTYLIRDLSNRRRMDAKYRAAITIKAWNAYRVGKSSTIIVWRRAGDKPEDFPVLK